MIGYFYITKNLINGRFYYGSGTIGTPNYFGSNIILDSARKKYGDENFEHIPLKYFKTRQEAFDFEDRFLKLYKISKNPASYNMKDAGQGGDTFTNNPNKEIIRERMKSSAKNNYLKGKTYVDVFGESKANELKQKLSDLHIGKQLSQDTLDKKSESMKKFWTNKDNKNRMLENNLFILNNPSKDIERRKQMSIERTGENNPAARTIEIEGIKYNSISNAIETLGLSRSTIQRRLDDPLNTDYKRCNN